VRCGDPEEVGVEEEEEDQRDGHEVHVDAEEDAAVVEAPTALNAAHGFGGAEDGAQRREQEQQGGANVREAGDEDRREDAAEHQSVAPGERVGARVEDGWVQRKR